MQLGALWSHSPREQRGRVRCGGRHRLLNEKPLKILTSMATISSQHLVHVLSSMLVIFYIYKKIVEQLPHVIIIIYCKTKKFDCTNCIFSKACFTILYPKSLHESFEVNTF